MLNFHPGEYEVWSDGSQQPRSIRYYKALHRVMPGQAVPEGWVQVATVNEVLREPRYWALMRLGREQSGG